MSNWSQKRKEKDKEWGRMIFEDIMVKKFQKFQNFILFQNEKYEVTNLGSSMNLKQDEKETTIKYIMIKLLKNE